MSEGLEKSNNIEGFPDDVVVEVLRAGFENAGTQEVLNTWLDQLQRELDVIRQFQKPEVWDMENIRYGMRRALVYYMGGHTESAISDLEETCDAAGAKIFEGSGLFEETSSLLKRMKAGEVLFV